MALFSPTLRLRSGQASENPRGFSVWCVLAKLYVNQLNYSWSRPLYAILTTIL